MLFIHCCLFQQIIWPQGAKVCILSTSIIDLLSNTADIGTGGVLDLSTISSQGNDGEW